MNKTTSRSNKNKKNLSEKKSWNSSSNEKDDNESTLTEEERNELIKGLEILNLSLVGIAITLYALLLAIEYINWEKIKVLDEINETTFAEDLEDLSDTPKETNKLYIVVSIIFIFIVWNNYKTSAAKTGEERNERTIKANYRNVITSLLVLLATVVNHDTVNDIFF